MSVSQGTVGASGTVEIAAAAQRSIAANTAIFVRRQRKHEIDTAAAALPLRLFAVDVRYVDGENITPRSPLRISANRFDIGTSIACLDGPPQPARQLITPFETLRPGSVRIQGRHPMSHPKPPPPPSFTAPIRHLLSPAEGGLLLSHHSGSMSKFWAAGRASHTNIQRAPGPARPVPDERWTVMRCSLWWRRKHERASGHAPRFWGVHVTRRTGRVAVRVEVRE